MLHHTRRGQPQPDERAARIAAGQHGQISHAQLLLVDLTARQIEWRVRTGRLHRVHRGVYAVGVPPTSDHARWAAALLAVPASVLCGRSAAALWRIWHNARSAEHVLTPRRGLRRQPGLRIRTTRALEPRDTTRRDGLAVTTPARTLLDLAAELAAPQLADALTQARVDRLLTDDDLRAVLARHPRHRGTRRLGDALTGPATRSRLEAGFLSLIDEEGLPRPETNARAHGFELDAHWPAHALAVELDGKAAHAARWAQDAARDAALRAAGLTVVRLTWWDVERDRARTAARLRAHFRNEPRTRTTQVRA